MLETVPENAPGGNEQELESPSLLLPLEDILEAPTYTQSLRDRFRPISRFAITAGLNLGSALAYEAVALSGGLATWQQEIFDKDLSDPLTLSALAFSAGAMTVSVWVNGEVNLRMARAKGVEFNYNFLSLSVFKLGQKFSNSPAATDWSLRLSSYAWDAGKQVVALTTAAVFDPNIAIGANLVGAGLNFAQAGLGWAYLHSKQKC